MSKTIGPAIKEKNPKPIQELAEREADAGADYLDLNVGPARKQGDEMMEWLVKIVEEVTDVPLSIDTTNPIAMEAGLKTVTKARPLINSVSAQKERLENMLPLAKKYDVPFIALLLSDEGIPRNTEERANVFFEIFTPATDMGISPEDIWVDGIIFPVSADQNQVVSFVEFLKMLPELAGVELKTTCGLSNVSNGSPKELRSILNQSYLAMLLAEGLYSAILDVLDKELMKVHQLIGDTRDINKWLDTLDAQKRTDVEKTMKVLRNEVLYCHSWLDL
jgi:5-methyltetrahydrofolate corrinoid/iron sulfur protein methyltransferase